MKILLLNSPWINNDNEYGIKAGTRWAALRKKDSTMPYFPFPYFLASACTFLKKQGFDAHIKDAVAEELNFETCLQQVAQMKPEVLVIEAFTPSIETDLAFAQKAKDHTGCKTIFCGAHVTALPHETLKNACVDFVVLGEYDLAINNICKMISEGRNDFESIKGIVFRKNGLIKVNPGQEVIKNLDDLPIPERDELPVLKYNEPLSRNFPNARIVSSRGCPFHCIFCIEPFINGKLYRKRSVNIVIDEIMMLIQKYGVKEVVFDDAIFTIGRAKEVANEILKRKIKIAWSCWMEWNVGFEDLKLLKQSGCVALKFGIETANPEMLKTIGKPPYLSKLKELIQNCKKLKITPHGSVMLGLPGETKESLEDTMDLTFSLGLHSCQLSIATPLPGTPFYEMALNNGWLVSKDWKAFEPLEHCVIEYPNCSKEDILHAVSQFKKRKVRHFLKNPMNAFRYAWKLLRLQGPKVFFQELGKKVKFILNSLTLKKNS